MAFLLLSFLASPIFPSPSIERRPKFLRTLLPSSSRRRPSSQQTNNNNKTTKTITRRRFPLLKRSAKPAPAALPENMELMTFLSRSCPEDVLPKILAYCGPQQVAALSQTCQEWRRIVMNDATWRILCEELYKWSDGDELPSTSWKEYYQNNPCVPVDYPSLSSALAAIETAANDGTGVYQTRSVRILLRPGDHVLKQAITIQATAGVNITMETMQGNFDASHVIAQEERTPPTLKHKGRLARRAIKIRNRINCRSTSQDDDDELLWDVAAADAQHPLVERLSSPPKMNVASLILHTRKNNEPLLSIKQGSVTLRNLEILHNSHGMDIWNGNAAIQIQPPKTSVDGGNVRPSLAMETVEVVSHSGRGIVNIDGGFLEIRNSYVHDCAATGIYVGGQGTQALIQGTDVLQNGNGTCNRRGVGRGHSGVYLEQGKAIIRDCNISRNSLTGISAVSRHNTSLEMEASDLVANGAAQLEMPRGSSAQESWDLERNNRLAAIGLLRSRSSLVPEQASPDDALPETAL